MDESLKYIDAEVIPTLPFVQRMRSNPDLIRVGFEIDTPLLQDPDVRYASGFKGSSFSASIKSEYYWNKKENFLIGAVYFPSNCEGGAGNVHGGAIATILDSWFGYTAVRTSGPAYVTLNLSVNYKKFVKLSSVVQIQCKVTKEEGRKLWMEAVMSDGEGSIHADATAVFYRTIERQIPYEKLVKTFGVNSGITKNQILEMIAARKKHETAKL